MTSAHDPSRSARCTLRVRAAIACAVAALLLAACAPSAAPLPPSDRTSADRSTSDESASDGSASDRATDDGAVSDAPKLPAGWSEEGEASWYGPNFAGRLTANGEIFDPSLLTAAHRTLPFDARVRVTNLDNGRSVLVRINDRGPFARGRVIDLSRAAAEVVGLVGSGVAPVRVEPAGGPEGLRTVRADERLSGYDVIVPGVPPGSLLVLRSGDGASVVARAVALEPPSAPDLDGSDVWTSAGLSGRLGSAATVVVD